MVKAHSNERNIVDEQYATMSNKVTNSFIITCC